MEAERPCPLSPASSVEEQSHDKVPLSYLELEEEEDGRPALGRQMSSGEASPNGTLVPRPQLGISCLTPSSLQAATFPALAIPGTASSWRRPSQPTPAPSAAGPASTPTSPPAPMTRTP